MSALSIKDSLATMEYTVLPSDLNGYNLLHGGRLLTLADEAGFVAAHRFSGSDCLTAAVHRAKFYHPARLGDIIRLNAQVALTGRSSMWVDVAISKQNKPVMNAVFVYAAVDDQFRPTRVTQIHAVSPAELALQQHMLLLKTSVDGERP